MKKFIFIASLLFASVASSISAAILKPYVVDEKPQVLFGDSWLIDGYYGLENYTADYIGGYLHITFTYTHHSCCFAAYPPSLYVTALDPRGTTTPQVKYLQAVYQLSHQTTNATDWYSYDVQFDATGYTAVVKQAGVTEVFNNRTEIPGLKNSDWVALANLYPQWPNRHSMAFTPLTVAENVSPPPPPEPQQLDPVIIIPGIMGSAYKNGELVIDPILHTYDDLIATLVANGYISGENLFTFPYEWRNSNIITAKLLRDRINEVQTVCNCEKVDLVAHSMGGLVARQYIQSDDYENDVDQLIFLGTPHKGAPKAYLQWEGGESDLDVRSQITKMFFSAESLRNGYSSVFNYINGRPILSVRELLPVFNYIKDDDTGLLRQYPTDYPTNVFLENLSAGILRLTNSGIRISNIIGNSGENQTIEKIRVKPTDHSVLWQHGEPDGFGALIGDGGLERGAGDNTVTIFGSMIDGIASEEIQASHNRLPTVAANRVLKIISGNDSSTNIDTGAGMDVKVLLVQLLSPIDVVITAPDGRRIGKDFVNGSEFDEIQGAFYSGFQTDDEYIAILNPLDGQYKVEVQGTGSGGEYGVLTSYISEVTSVTQEAQGLTEPGQVTTLSVSLDNNNPDVLGQERIITTQVLLNDIIKAYELGWITDKRLRDQLVRQAKQIIKTEAAGRSIDKKLTRALLTELKGYNAGKMNEKAYNLIKEDLEWLLNN